MSHPPVRDLALEDAVTVLIKRGTKWAVLLDLLTNEPRTSILQLAGR